jgi:sugar (pentulose or hexulose) kinase
MDVVVGIDAGTSALKTGVITLDGRLLALETEPYGLSSPQPGAMEQDAEAWWQAMAATTRRALTGVRPAVRVLGVSIGGQAPTFVATDADMRPMAPAVTWMDQRPLPVAEELYAQVGQPVPVWGSWPAQAAWFSRNRPDALRRSRWFFGCPEYLTARLTGVPVMSLYVTQWEVEAGGLDPRLVPPELEAGQRMGSVSSLTADETGLPAGTPVVTGFVDGVLGVLGSGAQKPGDACMNGGTSGTFSTVCLPPLGYPMLGLRVLGGGAVNTSGKALDWFVHQVAPAGASCERLLDEAATVGAGADGLLFLPHLAGERSPVRDPRTRAAWVGLTLSHDRRHLLRAVLEGVAFSFRALQCTIEGGGAQVRDVRSVGGQARSPLWNQIKADVLGRPVHVPEVVEAAVTGAAILAAQGVGAFGSNAEAVSSMVRIAQRLEPQVREMRLYGELFELYSGLYPALRQTSWRLTDLRGGPAPLGHSVVGG